MNNEELTEIVLTGVREARKITDDNNLYGKINPSDVDSDKYDVLELRVFKRGEKAREFLFGLQNFYNFPENQEVYFRDIKQNYFNRRTEILIEIKKLCHEESSKATENLFEVITYSAGAIAITMGIDAAFWTHFMTVSASCFGAGAIIMYIANETYVKKRIDKSRKEINKLFKKWREVTESITFEQFRDAMYKNKAEIEGHLIFE